MRVINSATRATVLRELALLRALCASLRDSRRPTKAIGHAMRASAAAGAKSPTPVLPGKTDLVLDGPT